MHHTLFHHKDEGIEITIEAYFKENLLVIEGYDIGPRVAEAWGDSDYEYNMTLGPESVARLYLLFGVDAGAEEELLSTLAQHYHGNNCFSQLRQLFNNHSISFQSFSWT